MMLIGEPTVVGEMVHSGWLGLIRRGEGGELGAAEDWEGEERKAELGLKSPTPPPPPPPVEEAE